MVIDTSRCVACHACEVACKSANNPPLQIVG
ncbi:4Fe-4S binding protein [Adlercreutzia sp.]